MGSLPAVLARLRENGVKFTMACFWHGGIEIRLGDEMNGWKAHRNFDAGERHLIQSWLDEETRKHFPQSEYTQDG